MNIVCARFQCYKTCSLTWDIITKVRDVDRCWNRVTWTGKISVSCGYLDDTDNFFWKSDKKRPFDEKLFLIFQDAIPFDVRFARRHS